MYLAHLKHLINGSFYFLLLSHGISAWYIICQEVDAFSSYSIIE